MGFACLCNEFLFAKIPRNDEKAYTSRKRLVSYCETKCYGARTPTQPLRKPAQPCACAIYLNGRLRCDVLQAIVSSTCHRAVPLACRGCARLRRGCVGV